MSTGAGPGAGGRRPRRYRFVGPVLSVALVAAVFVWFLPQFTSLSQVWAAVVDMTWLETSALLLAAVWNLITYQFLVVATTPGMTLRQATVATEAATAVSNTVLGGAAVAVGLTYAMNSSWGFSRSRTSVALLVAGLWNTLAKLGLPVLALALLAFTAPPSAGRLAAGVAGLLGLGAAAALLWTVLRSPATAAAVGRAAARAATAARPPFRRPAVTGWDRATTKFRDRTVLLLRARWHWITLATLVSHLSLFLLLLLSLRSVGVGADQVGTAEALAVFAFARLLTAVPLTPGGLGVVELALITGLAAAGGPRALVAAAVLVFRALSYVLPIPVGLGSYLFWRHNRSWRREANAAPRTELVPEAA
ncbi:lysylphosphatidylglycerol synthase transmembrane domain-containing protein [Blastococcus sp. VKM Ac-2987]|uniref:lysylphosphatidylglycerol synthase transmembrane domain-containing protein n=1 Tax=Blastococcus sp. VKM Ac-2987 TaxID=3004141 RepID=UPI0022ABA7CC|nr:YbhN family protein [Blastococcus sp. VKM Ac-2987]MCZ2859214.1 YbhN family protein [Blastococcus sp. VKM Ac-2987]